MKYCLFALCAATLAAVAFAADKPKLGPEWTEDKLSQSYFKTMKILVTRSGGGNARNYHLDLEHDKVRVADSDGNIATDVFLNDKFNLELRKDPKGKPSSVTVRIDKWVYHDLNCDGEWDARSDGRTVTPNRFIWLNDQWVQVTYHHGRFGTGGEVNFFDGKTKYLWDGKVWTVKPAK